MNSEQWDERYRSADLIWSAGPNRFLVEEVSSLPPGRALDLACGEGRNSIWLSQRGWQVTASDFSTVAIDKAKGRARELGLDVDFSVADATRPVHGVFDLVIVFYLQIPAGEFDEVLSVASMALAPGGTLLVVGHDSRNLDEGYGGPSSPTVLYGPDVVSAALADLHIDRAETVERPVETADGTRVALDVLVRAHRPFA